MKAITLWAADAYNLTISNTAVTLQEAIEAVITWGQIDWNDIKIPINWVDLMIETNSIRWLDTGDTPTDSLWNLAASDWIQVVQLRWIDITQLQMIRATWSDATISIRVGNADQY